MNPHPYYSQQYLSKADTTSLLSRVSYLLCTCLLVTAGAAYYAQDLPFGTGMLCGIGAIACIFALSFTRSIPGLNLGLLYLLSVLEGVSLGPILSAYAHASAAGGTIIAQAFVLTAACVGGIGSYIWTTGKDFGYLGKFLFWALIGLLIVGVLTMLFAGPFASAQGQLIYCVIGAAIFVGFTLYDFSNIKHRFGPNDYVIATVSVYLDFLNLFMMLLQLLTMLQGGGGRNRN